ncbi:MAG: hypothetical protein ACPGVU_24270, partial [Limisphaerales bacterium]
MKTLRLLLFAALALPFGVTAESLLSQAKSNGPNRGIVAVVDDGSTNPKEIAGLVEGTELTVYVQCRSRSRATKLRAAIKGVSSGRLIVDHGSDRIELADNLADLVIANAGTVKDAEALRILRPHGKALVGERRLVKPETKGADNWSHPYHGPDNNPNSDDKLVRGDFRTQFIGYPMFSPMPQQTVSAGGVLFKAFGHIAHKQNQNAVLNTLM